MLILHLAVQKGPLGGTGRRAGLKIQWGQPRLSSNLREATMHVAATVLGLRKSETKLCPAPQKIHF